MESPVHAPARRTAFGADFDVPGGYLNTASIGVPAVAVADAVAAAVTGWRTGAARADDFDAPVARARAGFAALAGVEPRPCAFHLYNTEADVTRALDALAA